MNFTEINNNGTVEGFCLVKNLEVKKTAKGIPYLDLILTDSSGEIGAKLWDYKEELHGFIKQNSLLKVRGSTMHRRCGLTGCGLQQKPTECVSRIMFRAPITAAKRCIRRLSIS